MGRNRWYAQECKTCHAAYEPYHVEGIRCRKCDLTREQGCKCVKECPICGSTPREGCDCRNGNHRSDLCLKCKSGDPCTVSIYDRVSSCIPDAKTLKSGLKEIQMARIESITKDDVQNLHLTKTDRSKTNCFGVGKTLVDQDLDKDDQHKDCESYDSGDRNLDDNNNSIRSKQSFDGFSSKDQCYEGYDDYHGLNGHIFDDENLPSDQSFNDGCNSNDDTFEGRSNGNLTDQPLHNDHDPNDFNLDQNDNQDKTFPSNQIVDDLNSNGTYCYPDYQNLQNYQIYGNEFASHNETVDYSSTVDTLDEEPSTWSSIPDEPLELEPTTILKPDVGPDYFRFQVSNKMPPPRRDFVDCFSLLEDNKENVNFENNQHDFLLKIKPENRSNMKFTTNSQEIAQLKGRLDTTNEELLRNLQYLPAFKLLR